MPSGSDIRTVLEKAAESLASFNVLFQNASNKNYDSYQISNALFPEKLHQALVLVEADLKELDKNPESIKRAFLLLSEKPDSVDALNSLNSFVQFTARSFAENLETSLLESLSLKSTYGQDSNTFSFLAAHAFRLATVFPALVKAYLKMLENAIPQASLSRLNPGTEKLTEIPDLFKTGDGKLNNELTAKIVEEAKKADPFHGGRAFRYIDDKFHPTTLSSIRAVKDFYGYPAARNQFKKHFENFSNGNSNLPLLITSLPGLGKTHFTIAHVLYFPNLTLILPEPADLEKPFENLIKTLARRKDHRFVIFFDDIDTRKVDWYYFRTHVGGSFVLPENVTIVIASNYEFPANISSRGRGFVFPMFDEIACQEMVHDFLVSLGMKTPPTELVSVIAADYVEEFGQKMFEELSPRTLVRYLDKYNRDMKKRKRMLDMSREEVITRPDSQMFFDVNVKLMRALYGEDAINEIRNRQLGGR